MVRSEEGDEPWRATLSLDRGRLDTARLECTVEGGSIGRVHGSDAAVEVFSAAAARVALVSGRAGARREDDVVETRIEQLFARAVARRRARATPIPA